MPRLHYYVLGSLLSGGGYFVGYRRWYLTCGMQQLEQENAIEATKFAVTRFRQRLERFREAFARTSCEKLALHAGLNLLSLEAAEFNANLFGPDSKFATDIAAIKVSKCTALSHRDAPLTLRESFRSLIGYWIAHVFLRPFHATCIWLYWATCAGGQANWMVALAESFVRYFANLAVRIVDVKCMLVAASSNDVAPNTQLVLCSRSWVEEAALLAVVPPSLIHTIRFLAKGRQDCATLVGYPPEPHPADCARLSGVRVSAAATSGHERVAWVSPEDAQRATAFLRPWCSVFGGASRHGERRPRMLRVMLCSDEHVVVGEESTRGSQRDKSCRDIRTCLARASCRAQQADIDAKYF